MLNRNDETCKSHSKYFRVIFRHDHDKLFMETKYLKSTKGKHIVLVNYRGMLHVGDRKCATILWFNNLWWHTSETCMQDK